MSGITMRGPVAMGKRGTLLVGALMAAIAMYFAITASAASANNFCLSAYLAPYGHGGDRCWGPSSPTLTGASVVTHERAGCVDIADGSNNLMFSWVCGAAGSFPSLAASIYDFAHEGVWRKGVIRNNNLSFSAYFDGVQSCGGGCP